MPAAKKKTTKKTTKRRREDNLVDGYFSKEKQPTSEQKKAGRERKRQAQRMMDMIMEYQCMNIEELEKHVKKNKSKMSAIEYTLCLYVIRGTVSDKMLLDMLNRHIPYAPQKTEISTTENKLFDADEIKRFESKVFGFREKSTKGTSKKNQGQSRSKKAEKRGKK